MKDALLKTDRLIIRKFDLDDAAFIKHLLNDAGWLRFIGDRHVHSTEEAKNYLSNSVFMSYQKYGFGPYAIQLKQSGELIGMTCLIKRDSLEYVDIGYALLEANKGKGFAFEASLATQEFAHHILGIPKLAAITTHDNYSSKKLLSKLNFQFVKTIVLPGESEALELFLETM